MNRLCDHSMWWPKHGNLVLFFGHTKLPLCGINILPYLKIDEYVSDQHPVGLPAQLVEHYTGVAEVMGSTPVQAWIFSVSGFIFSTE